MALRREGPLKQSTNLLSERTALKVDLAMRHGIQCLEATCARHSWFCELWAYPEAALNNTLRRVDTMGILGGVLGVFILGCLAVHFC